MERRGAGRWMRVTQNDEGPVRASAPTGLSELGEPMVNPSFWAKRMLMLIEVQGSSLWRPCTCISPYTGEPLTGEPDAGEPPVRFGGRGSESNRLSLPLFNFYLPHSSRNFWRSLTSHWCCPVLSGGALYRPKFKHHQDEETQSHEV